MNNQTIETIGEKKFFGHPRGLATLFFTELWERFSYYGMRALLILFMTDATAGGLRMTPETAGAIYGLYTFGVYALALPGGWIADRLIGQRRAVLYGGVLISLGHYSLAVPWLSTFYSGLLLIVIGTGLLKPNVSAMVGDLYPDKGARRDAGFSIFYMGINIGAFLGPLVCSWLGEPREGAASWINWHYGFAAAGVGMTLALIQYVSGLKYLHGAGELKADARNPDTITLARRQFIMGLVAVSILAIVFAGLASLGIFTLTLFSLAQVTGLTVVILAAGYFAYVITSVCRDQTERQRVALCGVLFLGAAMFWSGFEQAGSSMNLFARDFTDRTLGDIELTAGALQSINPIFIILMAPVIGMAWISLGRYNPSIPIKFGLGLILLGTGFLVLAWGSTFVEQGRVGMQWLIATYFLHTVGELCLSPVGLSSITKLAPDRLVGQMMGTWFMGSALGNLISGLVAGYIESLPLTQLFGAVAAIVIVSGAIFWILYKPIRSLAVGIT